MANVCVEEKRIGMKIFNDMECTPYKDGLKYSFTDGDDYFYVFHFELDFGVVINIADVHMKALPSREYVADNNLLGLLTCMNGSVESTIGDNKYTQIPATGVFGTPPSKRYEMNFPGKSYRGVSIGFKPNADMPRIGNDPDPRFMLATLKERFDSVSSKPFRIPLELFQIVESMMLELHDYGANNKPLLRRRCAEVLHIMYWMNKPIFMKVATTKNIEMVDRICAEMVSDLTVVPNIKKICEDNDVNEFWFIRNFKKRYGRTPYEYHKIARHIRAAALLLTEQYSVGEVANIVGYASQSKFSMAFKEIHGCRPKHYPRYLDARIETGLDPVMDEDSDE